MTTEQQNTNASSSSKFDPVSSHDRLWWHIRFIYATIATLTVCLIAVLGTAAAMYVWHENSIRDAAYTPLDITDDVMGTGVAGLRWARGVTTTTTTKPEVTALRRQWQHSGKKSNDRAGRYDVVQPQASTLDNDDDEVEEELTSDDEDLTWAAIGVDEEHKDESTTGHRRILRMGRRKKRSERKENKKQSHRQVATQDDNEDDEADFYDVDDVSETAEVQSSKQSQKHHGRGSHPHDKGDDMSEGPPQDGSSSKDNSGLWLTTYSKIPVSDVQLLRSLLDDKRST